MVDMVPPERRSEIMRRITGKDTEPELAVRRLLHRLGYRFRLYRKDLPGKPDIVLPKLRTVILVHGCFWHGHGCSPKNRRPKSNTEYWNLKIDRNSKRDAENLIKLRSLGWKAVVIWACETKDLTALEIRLQQELLPSQTGMAPH
jgi:DNA mismatch endonuclease, patch repair protein